MNQFETLCKLASNENWCWNLMCTTCGHMHFRYAFAELATGKSPESKEWIVSRNTRGLSNKLGRATRRFTDDQKDIILSICLNANISSIAQNCKFPDWLGYLGLILNDMHTPANFYKAVSSGWASQLKDLTLPCTPAYILLCEIVDNKDHLLDRYDLETCQRDIKRSLRYSKLL
ncbi:MAG TPA: hypothetical protein EYQ26_02855 [Rhodospirillales bacterium]|nr:hypothetical protein [Rhodospirillales bacterium]